MTDRLPTNDRTIAWRVAEELHVDPTRRGTARLAEALASMAIARKHTRATKPPLQVFLGPASRDIAHRRGRR